MSEVREAQTKIEEQGGNILPKKDIAREMLEGMTPKHTTITNGEWKASNRTYTLKDQQTGMSTVYKLVFLGSDSTSGNVEHVVIEHYQETVSLDGKPSKVEVVKDKKTNEWRKLSLADKIVKYSTALTTTGHITEVRQTDNKTSHVLNMVEHDMPRPRRTTMIHV